MKGLDSERAGGVAPSRRFHKRGLAMRKYLPLNRARCMDREIKVRIVLEKPPAGVDIGLQKGRGTAYETIQTQRSARKDLKFEFTVMAKAATLGGPFVQGPPAERFVYLDIGTYAGQTDSRWSRRLKIPLTGITARMIEQATRSAVWEARVPGTGRDGGPNCATVKDFSGWSLKRS
jgi:hypothetical protein